MTVEQLARMHSAGTEDYELVDGELIPLPNRTPRHAKIRGRAEGVLNGYFERNPIGEVFAEVDCRIAPEIAVEVLSLSERAVDVRRKVRDYLRGGSLEVWLLDYANCELQVHTGIRLLEAAAFLETRLLPGFKAGVTELIMN